MRNRMSLAGRAGLGVVMMLAGAGAALAQDQGGVDPATFDRAPYRLVQDHLTGGVVLEDHRGRMLETWDGAASASRVRVEVPPDRPLEVVIRNANSLLYDYRVRSEPIQGRTVHACRDLGGQFLASGFLLSTVALRMGMDQPLPRLPMDFTRYRDEELDPTFGFAGQSAAALLTSARESYGAFVDFRVSLDELAGSLEDSLLHVAERADFEPIDELLNGLERSIERAHPGMSDPRSVPAVAGERYGAAKRAVSTLAALDPAAIRLPPGTNLDPQAVVAEGRRMDDALEAEWAAARTAYRKLQRGLQEIREARSGSVRRAAFPASGAVQRIVIERTPSDRFPTGMDGVPRVLAGETALLVEPGVRLLCEVGVGVTWMDQPVRYGIDGAGRLRDESQRDDLRTSIALMMHFSVPAVPVVGGLAGIGIGSGAPDLYLGGSIRMFAPLVLNGGWIWQRQATLPAGIQLGDELEDPEVLDDLSRRYRSAVFFGIGFMR